MNRKREPHESLFIVKFTGAEFVGIFTPWFFSWQFGMCIIKIRACTSSRLLQYMVGEKRSSNQHLALSVSLAKTRAAMRPPRVVELSACW